MSSGAWTLQAESTHCKEEQRQAAIDYVARRTAELEKSAIPLAEIGRASHEVDLRFALHGGEDYELLFTAPRSKRVPSKIAGIPITMIGFITRGKHVFLVGAGGVGTELLPHGWEHFRK